MRIRAIALFAALMLASSAPGAFADDGEDDTPNVSRMKVELIADFVAGDEADEASADAAQESVSDLRTSGIGWGALLEIYKLAAAMGVDAETLISDMSDFDGFAFGVLKNSLTDEQRAAYDAMPKNFGTLKVAEMKAEKAERKAEKAAEKEERKADKKAERDERKEVRDEAKAERDADKADKAHDDDDATDDEGDS